MDSKDLEALKRRMVEVRQAEDQLLFHPAIVERLEGMQKQIIQLGIANTSLINQIERRNDHIDRVEAENQELKTAIATFQKDSCDRDREILVLRLAIVALAVICGLLFLL